MFSYFKLFFVFYFGFSRRHDQADFKQYHVKHIFLSLQGVNPLLILPSLLCQEIYQNSRLQNSPYFFVFKYARAVKQKVWNEAENRERDLGRDAKNTPVRLLRHTLPVSLLILRKKPTVLQSIKIQTVGAATKVSETLHNCSQPVKMV